MKKLLFLLLLVCQIVRGQNLHNFPDQTNNINRMIQSNGSSVSWRYPLAWKAWAGVGDSATDNAASFQSFVDGCDSTPTVIYIGFGKFKFNSGVHTHTYSRIAFIGAGGLALNGVDVDHIWNKCNTRVIKNATGYWMTDSATQASNFIEMGFEDQTHSPTSGGAILTLGYFPKYMECSFTNLYNGVQQTNATYSFFSHCNFADPVNYGIYNYDLSNPDQGDMTIDNCNFSVNETETVAMIYQNSSGGTKVSNCKWNGIGTVDCIYLNMTGSTSDLFCANNSFENYTGYAIHIDVASGITFYNATVVGGNISSYRGGSGIYLDASSNHYGIGGVSVAGVRFNSLNKGIVAKYIDNLAVGTNTYDTATITTLFDFTACTRVYYDRQIATDNVEGLMGIADRKLVDTLQSNGGIASAFLHTSSLSDTDILFTFYGSDNDIADLSPNINVPGGAFVQMFSSGNTTIQTNGGYGFLHTEGGTTGYLIPTSSGTFDVSTKFLVADFGTGLWSLLARGVDASNYLALEITASGIFVVQDVGGTSTGLFTLGSNPLVANDVVHLQVSGSNWKFLINSDSISSGTFDASLTTHKAGIEISAGTQATQYTNFLVTSIPDVNGSWGIVGDSTVNGDGVGTPLHVNLSTVASKYSVDTMRTRINAALGGSGGLPDSLNDGIYLPTYAAFSNVATVTGDSAIWLRVGNTIEVEGTFNCTATSGSTPISVNIPVPVHATSTVHAMSGTGVSGGNTNGNLVGTIVWGTLGSSANIVVGAPGQTSSMTVRYHFTYRVH